MIDEKKLIGELDAWWETLDPRTNTRDSIICDVIESVIEKINDAEKVGEWIPCSERLPEEYGSYLVAWKPLMMFDRMHQHYYEIVEFDPDDEALWIGNIEQAHGKYEIIAWQPLPEPYKGEI